MHITPTVIYKGIDGCFHCLFVESIEGRTDEELKQDLIAAAKDQGLDYALRVRALSGGGGGMQANVDRWVAQFETEEAARLQEVALAQGQWLSVVSTLGRTTSRTSTN